MEQETAARPLTIVQRYFWIVPFWLVQGLIRGDSLGLSEERTTALALTAGLVAGAAWQLIHRRDVVDRLGWLMALTIVIAVVLWIPNGEVDPGAGYSAFGALGVVMGLAIVERYLRPRP